MKKVIALAGLAAAVVVARHRLMHMMADAAPELRRPACATGHLPVHRADGAVYSSGSEAKLVAGPGVRVTERHVAGEHDGLRPVVLWIHSGGMVISSPQLEAATAGRLARELDARRRMRTILASVAAGSP